MGTPYEIETKGKILLLEDVGEEPFRIDRMLNQLKLAGKLQQSAGILFGECNDCGTEGRGAKTWDDSLGEVLDKTFENINIPVFYGLTFGHTADQLTIPLGAEAEMDADSCVLNIIESGVL
jgi:muramoyltetrapeptide carboxypeptidase